MPHFCTTLLIPFVLCGVAFPQVHAEKQKSSAKIDYTLAAELAQMVEADQSAIQEAILTTDSTKTAQAYERKDAVLCKHTKRIKEMFRAHGFLGFDLVGQKGSHDFWILVQHADCDVAFQQAVLLKMKPEVARGNAAAVDYAYLTDRVAKNDGKPQNYGTQVTYTRLGQAIPMPVRNSRELNTRRKAIGLDPIETYLNAMSKMHFEMNRKLLESKGVKQPAVYEEAFSEHHDFPTPATTDKE